MVSADRQRIGKANRSKGIRAERDVASYLRANGWPDAERMVVTGWRAADRSRADGGDIAGLGALTLQIKATETMTPRQIAAALDDVDTQAVTAGADMAAVIHKRTGRRDVGAWYAYVRVRDLATLLGAELHTERRDALDDPTCLATSTLVALLRRAGYGGEP